MKIPLTIAFLSLLSPAVLGQRKGKKKRREYISCAGQHLTAQFRTNDSVVTCNTCHWDACGNLINVNRDTVHKNTGIVAPHFIPMFLTVDSILLTKQDAQILLGRNKIQYIQFMHCNDVAARMGFIAVGGVYLVGLKDTAILWQPLVEAVNKKYKATGITASQITVDGCRVNVEKLKYPVSTSIDINIIYIEKHNQYCVLTEPVVDL